MWGPRTIDRCASHKNMHLACFNLHYFVPGTEAVDDFTTTWAAENNWLVPPISCVSRVILHVLASRAPGSLVVPHWPSSLFWPLLFATDIRIFPSSNGIFTLGDYKDSLLGSSKFTSEVMAVRLEPFAI